MGNSAAKAREPAGSALDTPLVRAGAARGAASAASPPAPAPAPASAPQRARKSTWAFASEVALVTTYALLVCVFGVVVWQLVKRQSERHVVAWAVGAAFVGVACPLSLHDINLHVSNYVSQLQRFYIRIIAMVPLYAIESWLALRFKDQALYFEVAREAYEAYVIHAFYSLLVEFLGSRERAGQALRAKAARTGHAHAHMLFPFCWARPWRLDLEFLDGTRLCVFQYVVVRLVVTFAIFVGSFTGAYEEGAWEHADNLFVYTIVALNASQLVALWALLMFYHELMAELQPLSPLPKFLAVKAVVFFSFWQSMAISAASHFDVIKPTLDYTQAEVAAGLQDLLICFEMACAAVAHRYLFSSRDFWREPGDGEAPLAHLADEKTRGLAAALADVLPGDVLQEAVVVAGAAQAALDPRVLLKKQQPKIASAMPAARDFKPAHEMVEEFR